MQLQNVEKIENQQVQTINQKLSFSQKIALALVLSASAINANAATLPSVDTADILSYIGLLVAAVATVASASLMIHLAAKGIKALRTAF